MNNDKPIRLRKAYEMYENEIGIKLETLRRYHINTMPGNHPDMLTAITHGQYGHYYVKPSEMKRYVNAVWGSKI